MRVNEIIRILKRGGVGVIPTDTIYGIVASAFSREAVQKIYRLRRRNPRKPMIILIGSLKDLELFGILLEKKIKTMLMKSPAWKIWPGKVSVVLPCPAKKFSYLHRGAQTLAFRLPAEESLRNLLKKTGPLAAPSANIEGKSPATTIGEAKKYFGDRVDFYWGRGKIAAPPSSLIQIKEGKIVKLR